MADMIIQILEKTISSDKEQLEAAQHYLEQAAQTNLPEFVKSLSQVIHNAANSPVARNAAGLQLKNTLTSKDHNTKLQYQQRWLSFPIETRDFVKKNVVAALGTETMRPSQVAQCVAYIAVAELPHNQWPQLIQVLTQNVTNNQSTEMMKESTLEAIGYICQDIEPTVLAAQSNDILTAIVHGMKKDEPSNHVKLAATTALHNSLEFTKANFEKESERHFIMQVVCEATQSSCNQVRVAALQCLVRIMSLYYQFMEHYMGPALFAITMEAMKSETDEEALQGIEFWSNVCEEETDLAMDAAEAAEEGRPPENISMHYAKGALPYLVPVLMHTLTKQEEYDDEDDWNPCKAAGVCLMSLAMCCTNDVVQHVLPFVNQNVNNPDWRFRDAAVMAFGSILSGPDPKELRPLVEQAITVIIKLMADPSVTVRDTTAWVIGRVCQNVPAAVIQPGIIDQLLDALVTGLSAEPRVAANVCWAFSSFSEACYEIASEEDQNPKTYILSKYFDPIITKLLETTDRPDGNVANLRSAAYEALMEMIKNSPKDCYNIVQKTTMTILQRLQHVLQLEGQIQNVSDRTQYNDLQSLLCATLQSVLSKMTPEDAPKFSDHVMAALLQMFSSNSKSGGVQEDALMAVSTLAEVLGKDFLKYMPSFSPFLLVGLVNFAEHQACNAAIGVTGDICRALDVEFLPYCDEIMNILLQHLCNKDIEKSIRPSILSAFGDIALAIGPEFQKYLNVVLQTLTQAAFVQIEKTDYDMIDYQNSLRESCLEAYTGIIHCCKGLAANSAVIENLRSQVPFFIEFIMLAVEDPDHSDSVFSGAIGFIGDLASLFGISILQLLEQENIQDILAKGRRTKDAKTRSLASWATREIKRLKHNAENETNKPSIVASS